VVTGQVYIDERLVNIQQMNRPDIKTGDEQS